MKSTAGGGPENILFLKTIEYAMKKETRKSIPILIALLVGYAILTIVMLKDLCDSRSYALFFVGMMLLCWGFQWAWNSRTFDDDVLENFFIRRENLEYYDVRRIIVDRGKAVIVMGAVSLTGGLLYHFTGETHHYDYTFEFSEPPLHYSYTIFDGINEIFYGTILVMLIILLVFLIVCRRSKYLKDPLATPPKRDRL